MASHFRQEVLNVILAQLLMERGIVTAPESIIAAGQKGDRRMPDVVVNYRGLRTAIEGEIGYRKSAKDRALKSAQARVEENIAHIGVAMVYPSRLRDIEFSKLKAAIGKGEMEIAIVTEGGPTEFVVGDVNYLDSALRQAFQQLVQEDIVAQAVAALDGGIERFAATMAVCKGDLGRVAGCLGIRGLPLKGAEDTEEAD